MLFFEDVFEMVRDSMVGHQYRDFWRIGTLIDDYDLDHITPLSRGGYNAIGNLCVTSRRINRIEKRDLPLNAWLRKLWSKYGVYHPMMIGRIDTSEIPRQIMLFDTA